MAIDRVGFVNITELISINRIAALVNLLNVMIRAFLETPAEKRVHTTVSYR